MNCSCYRKVLAGLRILRYKSAEIYACKLVYQEHIIITPFSVYLSLILHPIIIYLTHDEKNAFCPGPGFRFYQFV